MLFRSNRRDFNEISSISRTYLDLEPFKVILKVQIEIGPANRRDFNEISSISRTYLDLEPFKVVLKV